MLTLTLDTATVIAGSNREPTGQDVDRLIELALEGRVHLALTTALTYDQRSAGEARQQQHQAYLSQLEVLPTVAGPWRFNVSEFNSGDGFADEDTARADEQIKAIVGEGNIHDVHHLIAHWRAQRDVFVTLDHRDILRNAAKLASAVGIVVETPAQAVQRATGRP